jgi:hypothetical protein
MQAKKLFTNVFIKLGCYVRPNGFLREYRISARRLILMVSVTTDLGIQLGKIAVAPLISRDWMKIGHWHSGIMCQPRHRSKKRPVKSKRNYE